MSAIVVVIDQSVQAPLTGAQRELASLAVALGQTTALLLGPAGPDTHQELSLIGVSEILSADGPQITDYSIVGAAEAVVAAVHATGASVVLAANDNYSKDVAARAAALLDAGIISDVVGLTTDLVAEKSDLAGSYTVYASVKTPVKVFTVKPNVVQIRDFNVDTTVPVRALEFEPSPVAEAARVVERTAVIESGRPALTSARIVVAGGRGTDGDFGPIEALADALGAAVGASRAATDAGWIDHEFQVGQTGVTVSPQLYISVGISGAIQQKAGMQTAQTIVAINTDPDSPIFEIADLGIVGDLFDVIPQAVEEIQRRRNA